MRSLVSMTTVFGLVFIAVLLGLAITRPAAEQLDGQQIFRFDTFGDEQLWTNVCGCTRLWLTSIQRRRSASD